MVSSAFNKKYHATLSDIVFSNKKIHIQREGVVVSIDTRLIDIEGLKLIFKVLDENYPKEQKDKEYTYSPKLQKLYDKFGYPKSTRDIASGELTEHMLWIQNICAENNIKTQDDEWDSLLERAEKYDY